LPGNQRPGLVVDPLGATTPIGIQVLREAPTPSPALDPSAGQRPLFSQIEDRGSHPLDVYDTPPPRTPPGPPGVGGGPAAAPGHGALAMQPVAGYPSPAGPPPGFAPDRFAEAYRPPPTPSTSAYKVTTAWQLLLAFVVSAGVGLGLTVLIIKLL
jgi:hypothetical protein